MFGVGLQSLSHPTKNVFHAVRKQNFSISPALLAIGRRRRATLKPKLVNNHVNVEPKTTLSSLSVAANILGHESLAVKREFEFLNIFVGFEQANKYAILTPTGENVGFIAEECTMAKSFIRNILHRRRPLKASVMDTAGNVILKINRPMYFLNSRVFVTDENDNFIGECVQDWHLWRRRYDLYTGETEKEQFGRIDGGFLSWDFVAKSAEDVPLGAVNKDLTNFAQEIFTDANVYAIHMDFPEVSEKVLTYDERATLLASAISIDTDYFSRSGGFGFFPVPLPIGMGGGAASAEAAAGGVAAGGMATGVETAGMAGAAGVAGAADVGGAMAMGGTAAASQAGLFGAGSSAASSAAGTSASDTSDFGASNTGGFVENDGFAPDEGFAAEDGFAPEEGFGSESSFGEDTSGFASEEGMSGGDSFASEGSWFDSLADIAKDMLDE